jgi:hypothetical protein
MNNSLVELGKEYGRFPLGQSLDLFRENPIGPLAVKPKPIVMPIRMGELCDSVVVQAVLGEGSLWLEAIKPMMWSCSLDE